MLVKTFYQPANRLWRSCSWTSSISTSTCTSQWLTLLTSVQSLSRRWSDTTHRVQLTHGRYIIVQCLCPDLRCSTSDKRLSTASNMGFVKQKADVPISQECSHRPSLLWNGDSLKVPKFGVLRKVAPFFKSTHICCVSIVSVWSNECLFSNAQCDLIRLVGAHSKSYMEDWAKTERWVLFCKWHSFVTVWYWLIDPAN